MSTNKKNPQVEQKDAVRLRWEGENAGGAVCLAGTLAKWKKGEKWRKRKFAI